MMLATVIITMETCILLPVASPNKSAAMTAVATISKFRSSDYFIRPR